MNDPKRYVVKDGMFTEIPTPTGGEVNPEYIKPPPDWHVTSIFNSGWIETDCNSGETRWVPRKKEAAHMLPRGL